MSEFDKKISALTSGSDSQAADEYVIARGGSNYKITGANIAAAATKLGTIATGVWQGTAIADTYLATIATAGKVSNSATTATSSNTASAIVARDGSGNFTAGTITAALSGNASTATALQTARTINGTSFDGTANITVTAAAGTLTGNTLASGVTASSLTSVGTLSSLTVSGVTTLSAGTASAPALTTSGDTNNGLFFPAADVTAITTAGTERLRVDANGNLGLGVTPSAWSTFNRVFQFGAGVAANYNNEDNTLFASNAYYGGSPANFRYITTGQTATMYRMDAGAHKFFTAASGTAGNAITFTQAMTLDASGNLGLATTSVDATAWGSTYPKLAIGTTTNAGILQFQSTAANADGKFLGGISPLNLASGVTAVESAGIWFYQQGTSATTPGSNIRFATRTDAGSLAERARITSAGELLVGKTTTTANGGVVQVSNGVTFPATQSACSDANTLDDYEEGTFTPAFVNGTFTYSNRAGRYIKIGKMVTVSGGIGWTAASGSGSVEFTSPFTAVTDADYRFTGALGFTSGVTITGVTATWAGESNSARIALRNVNSNASPTAIVVADLAASGQLQFTVTYETA